MKNSNNKFIAGIVCGLVAGSIGTSYIGNFQSQQQVSYNQSAPTVQDENLNDSFTQDENLNDTFTQNENPNNNFNNENYNNNFNNEHFNREMMDRPKRGHHHQGQGSLEATESVDVASGNYADGTYEGSATGYAQDIKVNVTVSGGKISNIDIVIHNETPGFYERAFEIVPQEIISKQSTDVDTVSGATYSSVGIINAVNDALSDAQANV